MTKEELLDRLNGIEWNDFEVKEASGGLPKSMWETVSAFSNTAGGWIILGAKEIRTKGSSHYVISGVKDVERMEQEIIGTLRSRTKFNSIISGQVIKFEIDGKYILAFEIPLSPHRPVAIKSTGDVYLRSGSGDVLATDLEVDAISRDCVYGTKSEMEVLCTSYEDLKQESIASYRSYIRDFNHSMSFPGATEKSFCEKLNIVLSSGHLSYGSLLMFGKRESIMRVLPNFWIDYIEIPGTSYSNSVQRYTYRMPEQDNIWESFMLIMKRLRNLIDTPYIEASDIFGLEENSQLFCLREALVNFCAHADYFASAHPTIRVFDDRIIMQNPGRFILNAKEFRSRILSIPRNPSIIKFFRHSKLAENAGYGIDKIFNWKKLTGKAVTIDSDLLISTITFPLLSPMASRQKLANSGKINGENEVLKILEKEPTITQAAISKVTNLSLRRISRIIASLKAKKIITREGGNFNGKWLINSPNSPISSRQKLANNGEINGEKEVLKILTKEPTITQIKLAQATNLSPRKISRIIASLKNRKLITRIGGNSKGYWQINNK